MSVTPDPIAFHVRLDHERSVYRYERHLLQRLHESDSSLSNERLRLRANHVEAHKELPSTRYLDQADSERQQYMRRERPDICRAQLDDQWQSDDDSSDCYSDADEVSAEAKAGGVAHQMTRRSRVATERLWKRRVLCSSTFFSYERPSETQCLTWLLSMTEQHFQEHQLQDASSGSTGPSEGLFAEISDSSKMSPIAANLSSRASSSEPGSSHAKIPPTKGFRSQYMTKSQPQQEPLSVMKPKDASRLSRGESLLVLDIRKPLVTAAATRGQLRASYYRQKMAGAIDFNGQVRYLQGEKRYQCTQCN